MCLLTVIIQSSLLFFNPKNKNAPNPARYNRGAAGKTRREACFSRACNRKGGREMVWDRIALALVIIGALNWGAIGLFGFDLVAFLCGGQMAVVSRIVYSLVGIAGLWCVSLLFRDNAVGEASA